MLTCFVEGIGVVGPGLNGWSATKPILMGETVYERTAAAIPAADGLPAAERRRTGTSVKIALAAGREALQHAKRDPANMATVFASSGGDGDNVHAICETLATETREISPTRFHNSVHNAPSGYWGIATGSMAFSTSLCAFDASFAAGLLEAASFVQAQLQPVTLIAYDTPYPEPLHSKRPIVGEFGMGLVLSPTRAANSIASVGIRGIGASAPATALPDSLRALHDGVPAARGLTLLGALARGTACACALEWLHRRYLQLEIAPCR